MVRQGIRFHLETLSGETSLRLGRRLLQGDWINNVYVDHISNQPEKDVLHFLRTVVDRFEEDFNILPFCPCRTLDTFDRAA